ncbi:MAG: EMC3/TMCO1 family protein [Candidatus Woesearchaeota archaeon]
MSFLDSLNMMFSSLLDPVFSPLLKLPYLLSIIIISFLISLVIVVLYKYLTNQSLMKELKEEIKELQKQMKALRDKPQEMMRVQKRSMQINMKYMMHSMRPTLVTFIPIIIIFSWLNMHMAYYPLVEDQEFSALLDFDVGITGDVKMSDVQDIEFLNGNSQQILENQAKFVLNGKQGEYTLRFKHSDSEYIKDIIISPAIEERVYKKPIDIVRKNGLKTITISNKNILAFEGIPVLGSIPWVKTFGWLGSYILFSLIFSLGLRKLLKVY